MEPEMTFEDFCEAHDVRVSAEHVSFRPDPMGHWTDNGAPDYRKPMHFAARLTIDGVLVWQGFYSVGPAWPINWASDRKNGSAGHHFALTRQGHGCGFWDETWPAPYGDTLAKLAESYGSVDFYVGDDDCIHCG